MSLYKNGLVPSKFHGTRYFENHSHFTPSRTTDLDYTWQFRKTQNFNGFSWSSLCETFSWGLLLALTASEQCHPVPGIGVWEATLQASVWRSEYTHQHLRKGYRPQHGVQKYVQHFGSVFFPLAVCLPLQIFWYVAFLFVISMFLMMCDQVQMKKHLRTIQKSIL